MRGGLFLGLIFMMLSMILDRMGKGKYYVKDVNEEEGEEADCFEIRSKIVFISWVPAAAPIKAGLSHR